MMKETRLNRRGRALLLVVAALTVCGTMHAQHRAGEWSVVPKVGIDLSKFTNDALYVDVSEGTKAIHPSYREGLTDGFDVEYFVHEHAAVSAGVYYMNMGSRYKDFMQEDRDGGSGFSDSFTRMDFVQVPVMGSIYLKEGLAFRLGVQMGRMVHSRRHMTELSWTRDAEGQRVYDAPVTTDGDIVEAWKKKFYFGIPVALAYEYQRVMVEARYVRSLTHPINFDSWQGSYHSTFVFTVGYRLK